MGEIDSTAPSNKEALIPFPAGILRGGLVDSIDFHPCLLVSRLPLPWYQQKPCGRFLLLPGRDVDHMNILYNSTLICYIDDIMLIGQNEQEASLLEALIRHILSRV